MRDGYLCPALGVARVRVRRIQERAAVYAAAIYGAETLVVSRSVW